MKNIIVSISFILFTYSEISAQNDTGTVYISGYLRHFENISYIYDISEAFDLKQNPAFTLLSPDSNGYFSTVFELKKPGYFMLGRNYLFLEPGDSLAIDIDYEDPINSSFIGKGCSRNNFLRETPQPNAGSFLNGGLDGLKKTIQENIDHILILADNRKKKLDTLRDISATFRKLEYARIQAAVISSLIDLPRYFVYLNKIPQDAKTSFFEEYNKVAEPYYKKYTLDFGNPGFLQIDVYRDILWCVSDYGIIDSGFRKKLEDWANAKKIYRNMSKVGDKAKLHEFYGELEKVEDTTYQNILKQSLSSFINFNNGDEAIDFVSTDINGTPVQLRKYKGNVLYLDFWATWCGPCLEEMKYYDSLRNSFKADEDIVFITLSIDSNRKLWEKFISNKGKAGIENLIVDPSFISDYHVSGIPRYVIIDKNFKIVNLYGPKPSDTHIENYLRNLLTN